jgi:predicted dehydrogenase
MPQPNSSSTRRGFLLAAGTSLLMAGVDRAASIALAPPDKQPPNLPIPTPNPPQIGWAIVGLGQLALEQIMPAFPLCQYGRPVALVSGHPQKARKVADHYGVNPGCIFNYDNFDSIRDNPAISVVCVVLSHSMHAEYTTRALKAGKHVLCEKPMCVSVEEGQRMIDAAREANRKLMIAYRLRYEPFNQKMIAMARAKEFGPIRSIEAANVQQVQAPNIRLAKSLGGGPLMDVGIYCINAARYITGEDPSDVMAMQFQPGDDDRFREVPDRVTFQLRFPSGVLASCTCGFSASVSRRYRVFCDKGWMELDPAFGYDGQRLRSAKTLGSETEILNSELVMEPVNHFASEMDYFSQCVTNDTTPLTPGEEGLADMQVITAIQQAADAGTSITMSGRERV